MTKPENGRFARTLVNRYWKKLFGRAFVTPVDDMDAQPWNADLLDWLASDFVEHGYDLKFLLRRIMTSRTYQLPAVRLEKKEEKEYVFRGPQLRRLTAEEFVDAVSSVTGVWRVSLPQEGGAGFFARDWRLKSSSLTRALGRPIRDQVYTTRSEEATTLQSLELVNGEDLAKLLRRGAENLLNLKVTPPSNLYDSGVVTKKKTPVDIDISGVTRLWLLTEDSGSYNRSLVNAGWADVVVTGPKGEKRLQDLKADTSPEFGPIQIEGQSFANGLLSQAPSAQVYNLDGCTPPAGNSRRRRQISAR
ncbi:MAG: DUF1553 domain-containing protein [Terriglobia bacterium]